MNLKPLAGLINTYRLMLRLTIALTAVAFIASIYDLYTYANLPAGFAAEETLLPTDVISFVMGIAQLLLGIITVITMFRWIHRAIKNLRVFSKQVPITFTPGWAVGWFFVPLANLSKPYQVMKEIWLASHQNPIAPHGLVNWWWGLTLLSNSLGRVAGRLALRADDVSGYTASAVAYVFSDGLDVLLSVVTLSLVTRIGSAYSTNIVEKLDQQPDQLESTSASA